MYKKNRNDKKTIYIQLLQICVMNVRNLWEKDSEKRQACAKGIVWQAR